MYTSIYTRIFGPQTGQAQLVPGQIHGPGPNGPKWAGPNGSRPNWAGAQWARAQLGRAQLGQAQLSQGQMGAGPNRPVPMGHPIGPGPNGSGTIGPGVIGPGPIGPAPPQMDGPTAPGPNGPGPKGPAQLGRAQMDRAQWARAQVPGTIPGAICKELEALCSSTNRVRTKSAACTCRNWKAAKDGHVYIPNVAYMYIYISATVPLGTLSVSNPKYVVSSDSDLLINLSSKQFT